MSANAQASKTHPFRTPRAWLGPLSRRTGLELLLAATMISGAYYLLIYVPKHARAGEPVLALANYFLTYAPIQTVNQRAYVLPDSLQLWDTPAEIRTQLAALNSGEEVHVLGRFRGWAHVRTLGGSEGWVGADGLTNFETHEADRHLLSALAEMPAQAAAHPVEIENVHIEPSRTAATVIQVKPQETLAIFGRRLVPRSVGSTPAVLTAAPGHLEAWYLVKAGSHAGWILGRHVQLAIPESISAYAQDTNLVAWVVLNRVNDNGKMVPQYVVAEREGTENCDFTKIEVLTWWKRKQTYAVAFRKSGLQGYFPIVITRESTVPWIHLLLQSPDGAKYQMIYGLFDTLTHLLGTADNWASDATPEKPGPASPSARATFQNRPAVASLPARPRR